MKEVYDNNYLIRLCDQSGRHVKFLYANISKEQLDKIKEILESTEDDWD